MKKKTLRLLALLLAFALALPGGAFAADGAAGTAQIVSDPEGADIWLDGELYRPAVTPCALPLSAGEHTLSVRMCGYESFETTVRPGDTVEARLRAAIPTGENVRTLLVNADDWGSADGRLMRWEYYERFVLNGEPAPEWDESWEEDRTKYYSLWAHDALTDGVSLREAIAIALNDTGWYDEAQRIRWHYVIEFAQEKLDPYGEGVEDNDTYWLYGDVICCGRGTGSWVNGEELFVRYTSDGAVVDEQALAQWSTDGCFTVNGDRDRDGVPDVTLAGREDYSWDGYRSLMLMCSDVRVVGLKFSGTAHVGVTRPFWQPHYYFNIRDIYFTGCEFVAIDNGKSRFFGIGGGGMFGEGAERKGDPCTYDLDGFYIGGCSFLGTQFGVICAGGDKDYAGVKNLVFQGNRLVNGEVFLRNEDAHTWYMWGMYSEMGSGGTDAAQIGVPEHNTLENVTVSGNRMEYNADALAGLEGDSGYGALLNIGNSNLGGSHNTMRNVTVRCNRSRLAQANVDAYQYWPNAGIRIDNAAVGDGLNDGYDGRLASSMCEVSDNLFDGLTVEYNDFETTFFDVTAVTALGSGQTGTDNVLRNVRIAHNRIAAVKGLHLKAVSGTSDLDTVLSGALEHVEVEDNTLTVLRKTGWGPESTINSSGELDDFGVLVCGADIANYETNWDESGEERVWDKVSVPVSDVRITQNRITGFANGVGLVGANCGRTHYLSGVRVLDIAIEDNEITTDGVNKNCRCNGILLCGALDGGTDCVVHNVSVCRNRVTAANGLVAAGFWLQGMCCRYGLRDDRVLHVTAQGNRFVCADPTGNGGFPLAAADALSSWDAIPYALGRSAVTLTAAGNTAEGFSWGELPLSWLSCRKPSGDAAFLSSVQAQSDAATEEGYVAWSKDADAAACETPLYQGVCDRPNYRPGGFHRWYLSPFDRGVTTEAGAAPTCTEPGGSVELLHCAFCGAELRRETSGSVPALGHAWDEPVYVWSADNAEVSASASCARCGETAQETVRTVAAVTTAPTVNAEGVRTYTASFRGEAFTTQTRTEPIPRIDPDDDGLPCGGRSCPGAIFKDMPALGNWAHDPIDWAVVYGVTTGTSPDLFSPQQGCTRGQVVTFLWRAAGCPSAADASAVGADIPGAAGIPPADDGTPAGSDPRIAPNNPFIDVSPGKFYYNAVLWAVGQGITNGMTATTFEPDAVCSRGQIVTFLWRFAGEPPASGHGTAPQNPFTDVSAKAFYYKAVLWAVGAGVTKGVSATEFAPFKVCTRAEVVTFLYRCRQ